MSRSARFSASGEREPRRAPSGVAGFTLIEVLIALAIVAVALTAIGSLMAAAVRGTHAIDRHLSLVETARAVETALPDRTALGTGDLSGEIGGNRWRVDVAPLISNLVDPRVATPWVPQSVIIRVESPGGAVLRIDTVRLRRPAK
ncbi:MAG: type II secretion system protein [Xanthobacteraceae bacterium]